MKLIYTENQLIDFLDSIDFGMKLYSHSFINAESIISIGVRCQQNSLVDHDVIVTFHDDKWATLRTMDENDAIRFVNDFVMHLCQWRDGQILVMSAYSCKFVHPTSLMNTELNERQDNS